MTQTEIIQKLRSGQQSVSQMRDEFTEQRFSLETVAGRENLREDRIVDYGDGDEPRAEYPRHYPL